MRVPHFALTFFRISLVSHGSRLEISVRALRVDFKSNLFESLEALDYQGLAGFVFRRPHRFGFIALAFVDAIDHRKRLSIRQPPLDLVILIVAQRLRSQIYGLVAVAAQLETKMRTGGAVIDAHFVSAITFTL